MGRIKMLLGAVCLALATVANAGALENEFHGDFTAQFDVSNFNRTPTTDYNAAGGGYYDPTGVKKNQNASNFIEQRALLHYSAKADSVLKLVTAFELNYAYWGNGSNDAGSGSGGATGTESINFITKNVYLDYSPHENINLKLGMMPNNDSFKGVLFDTDMAGVLVSGKYGRLSQSVGFFRLEDKGADKDLVVGLSTKDMFMLDSKVQISPGLKVGAAYYFFRDGTPDGTTNTVVAAVPDRIITVNDVYGNQYPVTLPGTGSPAVTTPNYNDIRMHVLGLNAEYVLNRVTLNGFAIYETGTSNNRTTSAFAGNLGAKIKKGVGLIRVEFLYVSGDRPGSSTSGAFYNVPGSSGGHGYLANEMTMIGRDKNALMSNNSLVFNADNRGQGQIGGYLGYDRPFTPAFDMSFNVGFVAAAEDNAAKPFIYNDGIISDIKNGSKFLGSELNAEANYKVRDDLKLSARTGYAILGEYYKGVALHDPPMNVYDVKLLVKYNF